MRGYFTIGVYHPKTIANIGTLWRSAYQLGAAEIFTVSERWPAKQFSDTLKAHRHIPYRRYGDFDVLKSTLPLNCVLVGVEMGGQDLRNFTHPKRACYLLGAEDRGLPDRVMDQCHAVVSISSFRHDSYNVAIAGSLVMYDRMCEMRHRLD